MIQYLQRMRNKKGFTLVELVVVFAIIAVLIAVVLVNMIGGNTDKQLAANTNAKAFFTATQLTMTRAQLTERSIVKYDDADTHYIDYVDGVNVIKGTMGRTKNYLFIEAKFSQNGIIGINIADTFDRLMYCDDPDATMTKLEAYISQNLDEYLAESYDGYFYALVDNGFKVVCTHYCESRLPQRSSFSSTDDFINSMMINSDGKVKGNERILGTCMDLVEDDNYLIPKTGQFVFSLPTMTDTDCHLYYDTLSPI